MSLFMLDMSYQLVILQVHVSLSNFSNTTLLLYFKTLGQTNQAPTTGIFIFPLSCNQPKKISNDHFKLVLTDCFPFFHVAIIK